ncbi:MAG: S8 family serine peptidase [Verrucomicrobiota bacterium]
MFPHSTTHCSHADRWLRRLATGAWLAMALGLLGGQATAAGGADYVEGEALVIFKQGTNAASARKSSARHKLDTVRDFESFSHLRVHCHVRSATQSTAALIVELQSDPDVELAEPNFRRRLTGATAPNDADFSKLWALRNTGQSVNGHAGTAGADIHFLDAWRMAKSDSREIVVAVIDSGIDLNHPDLAANIWTNPGEIAGDGLDNDGNGKVDDVHGYDFVANDADPSDAGQHGTHVSGIIAGVANNGLGISGTAYSAHIMPLKISSDGTSIDTASELAAINYAVMMKNRGVNIVAINASFGSSSYSTAESNAIQAAGNAGIVFCTAAGNNGADNTSTSFYPANYRLSNMIVVAASDSADHLASFSNFGTKVDLAAPGVDIYSTIPQWTDTVTASLTRGNTSYAATPLAYSGTTPGLTATVYNCGFGYPADFSAAVRGNIALIQRGTLLFADKVTNAMHAGAIAAIIYNNVPLAVIGSLGSPANWIPAQMISQTDGQALLGMLPTTVTLSNIATPSTIYTYESGTSMATPYVTAAVAFAARNFPNETAPQRVARIVNHTTPVGYLTGKVLSGGRLNLAGIVDTDTNDLPDWWESAYFGSIGSNPAADPDGDGFTNLQEYLMGTQPNNPASKLAISQSQIVTNGASQDYVVTFPTASGVTYRVEWSDTLAVGSWVPLGSDIPGTGSPTSVPDASAVTLHAGRFYRVRLIAP